MVTQYFLLLNDGTSFVLLNDGTSEVLLGTISSTVNETEQITEAINPIRGRIKQVAETEQNSEVARAVRGRIKTIGETEQISESNIIHRALVRLKNETESISEVISRFRARVLQVLETIQILFVNYFTDYSSSSGWTHVDPLSINSIQITGGQVQFINTLKGVSPNQEYWIHDLGAKLGEKWKIFFEFNVSASSLGSEAILIGTTDLNSYFGNGHFIIVGQRFLGGSPFIRLGTDQGELSQGISYSTTYYCILDVDSVAKTVTLSFYSDPARTVFLFSKTNNFTDARAGTDARYLVHSQDSAVTGSGSTSGTVDNVTVQSAEDLITRGLARLITETENISEVINAIRGRIKQVLETENISESNVIARGIVRLINETEQIVEQIIKKVTTAIIIKVINETEQIVESILSIRGRIKQIIETEQIEESINSLRARFKFVNETEHIEEAINYLRGRIQWINETEQIEESNVFTRYLVRLINEAEQIVESNVFVRSLVRLKNEVVQIVEQELIHRGRVFITNETEQIQEAIRSVRGRKKWINETIQIPSRSQLNNNNPNGINNMGTAAGFIHVGIRMTVKGYVGGLVTIKVSRGGGIAATGTMYCRILKGATGSSLGTVISQAPESYNIATPPVYPSSVDWTFTLPDVYVNNEEIMIELFDNEITYGTYGIYVYGGGTLDNGDSRYYIYPSGPWSNFFTTLGMRGPFIDVEKLIIRGRIKTILETLQITEGQIIHRGLVRLRNEFENIVEQIGYARHLVRIKNEAENIVEHLLIHRGLVRIKNETVNIIEYVFKEVLKLQGAIKVQADFFNPKDTLEADFLDPKATDPKSTIKADFINPKDSVEADFGLN